MRFTLCTMAILAGLASGAQAQQTGMQQVGAPAAPAAQTDLPPPVKLVVTRSANLRTLADMAGYAHSETREFIFVVPKGVNILGKAGGGTGIDTGTWGPDVELSLYIQGNVYGGGGNGGNGGDIPGAANGTVGGDAIVAHAPLLVIITETGSVKAGGGGGGGANASGATGGSGGGGGFPNGLRGEAGIASFGGMGDPGRYGSPAGGGRGGASGIAGGKGGDAGQSGDSAGRSGGDAGFAIRGNGETVDVVNHGDIRGATG